MTGKQRILAKLRGEPTDSLPLMPITMMFAAQFRENALLARHVRTFITRLS